MYYQNGTEASLEDTVIVWNIHGGYFCFHALGEGLLSFDGKRSVHQKPVPSCFIRDEIGFYWFARSIAEMHGLRIEKTTEFETRQDVRAFIFKK